MASGKRWNRRGAVVGGAALAAGAYWALREPSSPSHSAIPGKGVLRRGNGAEPETLDNALSTADSDDNIIGDLTVGLVTEDARSRPIAGMATAWTTSPDGLTWRFKLREAEWSDGVPVTAEDFVFAWRRLVDPATAARYAYFLYVIKNARAVNAGKLPLSSLGVRAAGPATLEIALEHPVPYLLEMLCHMTMLPQPRHVVEAKGKDWSKPGNYVANGAFLLKEWVPNEFITLEKNPRFYDAA